MRSRYSVSPTNRVRDQRLSREAGVRFLKARTVGLKVFASQCSHPAMGIPRAKAVFGAVAHKRAMFAPSGPAAEARRISGND